MIENRHLILPYAAPYLAYVFIASVLGDVVSVEINYLLRFVVTGALLIWAWKWYIPLSGPRSLLSSLVNGCIFGFIGCVLWIFCLLPFTDPETATPWSSTGFVLRLISAGLLVPVFEELMVRGFAFRLALQWDRERQKKNDAPLHTALHEQSINDLDSAQWSWAAVIISTLVFMIGHAVSEWPAAVVYGLLLCFLLIKQKDLLSCIVAHGTTNILLAIYVVLTGSWHLW